MVHSSQDSRGMKDKMKTKIIIIIILTILLLYVSYNLFSVYNLLIDETVEFYYYNGEGSLRSSIALDQNLTINNSGVFRSDRSTYTNHVWTDDSTCVIRRFINEGGMQ